MNHNEDLRWAEADPKQSAEERYAHDKQAALLDKMVDELERDKVGAVSSTLVS